MFYYISKLLMRKKNKHNLYLPNCFIFKEGLKENSYGYKQVTTFAYIEEKINRNWTLVMSGIFFLKWECYWFLGQWLHNSCFTAPRVSFKIYYYRSLFHSFALFFPRFCPYLGITFCHPFQYLSLTPILIIFFVNSLLKSFSYTLFYIS